MIKLFTAATSNGHRAAIGLEESGLAYETQILDLHANDQRRAEFLEINPLGQIPTIIDDNDGLDRPLVVTQSAAILFHVAKKSGRLLPSSLTQQVEVLEWVLHAVADCGPSNFGMFAFSAAGPAPAEPAVNYYTKRLLSYLTVCDSRLAHREYVCSEYSIADIALYPIVAVRASLIAGLDSYRNLNRWLAAVGMRPAVQRGLAASKVA